MLGFATRPFFQRALICLAILSGLAAGAARAQVGSDRYASIVIDANSGTILSAINADEYRFPASLTKMMTIYMLFEAVRDRRLSFADYVPVSAWASSMPPTKLGLPPGSAITVEQALLGLVTKSANDAAAALGEMIGGDEDRFAQMMTLRARAMGMTRTTFRNASGLPDWAQVTTARDMAILARHLIQDFPAQYHYFSTPYFQFRGRNVYNHQRLLQNYPGADGLKTGWIEASGYNVVTSAVRGDVRLIGVVLGAASGGERDLHMAGLLDQAYERMGVSVMLARAPARMPAFIGAAHAAPAQRAPLSVHAAAASQPRARQVRSTIEPRAAGRRPVDVHTLPPRPASALYRPAIAAKPPAARPLPAERTTRTAHDPRWVRNPG